MKKKYVFIGIIISCFFLCRLDSFAQEGTKITQTTLVKAKVNSVLHVSCHGDKKGAINIMVSGGLPPYTYKWSNGETTQDIAGLEAGVYSVKIKDALGCPDSITVEVKEPEKLQIEIDKVTDILCFGSGNGGIDVTVSGGVTPYLYSWSDESTAEDLTNVTAGEYALLVTDANHCQEIISATIKQNPLIVKSDEKVQNVECSGDSTGTIDIMVSGGVPPYKYYWTTGERQEDLTNLPAGTYTVQVTDSRGCFESYSTKVFEPEPIKLTIDEVRHINCAGDNSGAIDVNVKGGVKPYKYRWNDSLAYTQDLAGLSSGKYTLVVEDSRKCKKRISQEITEPKQININIDDVKNVKNYGGSDGAIYISVTGGIEPYKYEWSNGPKTQDVANLPANNYTCRITDANKCVNTLSVNIEQPALLEVTIDKLENIKCYGERNGYINVSVKGGVEPYIFLWSNGDSTKNIRNLAAGNYNLKVTDAHGVEKSIKATIEQPALLTSSIQSLTDNLCFGDTKGIVDINVSGGTPPYSYNWSNGARTQDIASVPAGDYKVQIIDNNRCVDSLSVAVKQSSLLEVKTSEIVDISCFGKAQGSIGIDVSGGVTPYSFSWSNGSNTKDLDNLKAGQYQLKVTDAKGCDQSINVRVEEPPLLESSLDKIVDVKCKGDSTGSISLIIKGGTSPYNYAWSNGATTKDNNRIVAGSYNVNITDAKGCVNTLSATITEPSELYANLQKTTDIDCFGEENGAIDVSVGGGIPPYIYQWSNKATTQNLVGIGAGDYSLNVRDQNGCQANMQATIVENPELKVAMENVVDVLCNGFETGSASVAITGGLEPYSYQWSNGATTKDLKDVKADDYTLIVTDAKACAASISISVNEPPLFKGEITDIVQIGCHGDSNGVVLTAFDGGVQPYKFKWSNNEETKDIRNLVAGKYSLLATDNNGCEATLETTIKQPEKLELSLVSTIDNPCFGERKGAIDVSVIGGVTPYSYEWSNTATTQDLTDLEAGVYTLNVTGATGCTKSLQATITQPEPLKLSINSTDDVDCFRGENGAVDLSVVGGVEPYTYSWSNGASSEDLDGIVAGSYTVNVSDAHGCVNSISTMINQPSELLAEIEDVKNINCYGDSTGAISIGVSGGTVPYLYKWSNGATTEDISNLTIGEYSVEISDAKGCFQKLTASITQPELLVATVEETRDVLCKGFQEGSINVSVSGGVTPYQYSWSNGSKNQDLRDVGAGRYSIRIEDANGCARNLNAEIKEPEMLVVSILNIKNIKEYGDANGSISISVDGGVAPYDYSWSNSEVTQNIENLVAGNYSVIVKDNNGCRQDLNATIEQPDEIKLTIDSIKHIRCYGERTGYAKISAAGGVPPYSFKWDNGVVGPQLVSVPAGDYILTVTDANGVSKVEKVSIIQPGIFTLEINEISNPTCYELNNGFVRTEIKGGTTPYNFVWNNGAITQNLKGLTSGKYSIQVTDARGCVLVDSTELTKPEPLVASLLNTTNIKCHGQRTGKVNIAVRGGTAPYQYNWSHGSKEQNLVDLLAGNYTVKVMDANQCIQTVSATVNEPPSLVAQFSTVKDVPCQGENTGYISTSVTGGVPPYNYLWNTGDSTSSISNLVVGSYDVVIADSNGCTNNLSTNITEPVKLVGLVNNVNHVKCFGAQEGAIGIDVKGGTPPYKFGWSHGSDQQNQTGIYAGDYTVRVTDGKGCTLTLSATVEQPTQLIASLAQIVNINCFGDKTGSIDVNVEGGVEPYNYSWSNGDLTQDLLNIGAGNYTLKVMDANGCNTFISGDVTEPQELIVENTSVANLRCSGNNQGDVTISVRGGVEPYSYIWNTGATTRDIQNLTAGNYDVKVRDANGCEKATSAEVIEPPVLVKSIDAITHISCHGQSNGSVNISVSGGTPPYSYQWSNGNTSQDLLDVPAGAYSVLIREGNGCETSLNMEITEPTTFTSELLGVTHNTCYGDENGTITISAEGGTTPYSFKWNNGSSEQNLKNLAAGEYSVLVSDANGCNHTIKTAVEEPPKLVLTIDSARNVKCCGDTSGAIFITVRGGVGPYKYLWSHGATSQDITGLVEGQYKVEVTDFNGCVVNTPEEGATIYEKIIAQGKLVTRDILFDIGKATIKEQSFIEISRIASFMKEYPQLRFSIEGHTDSMGDEASNQILSEQRAVAIKESLIKFGIANSRLETKGYGESKPVDTNSTPEGRANNRRVEFIPL